jgi:hypothetical protein
LACEARVNHIEAQQKKIVDDAKTRKWKMRAQRDEEHAGNCLDDQRNDTGYMIESK